MVNDVVHITWGAIMITHPALMIYLWTKNFACRSLIR